MHSIWHLVIERDPPFRIVWNANRAVRDCWQASLSTRLQTSQSCGNSVYAQISPPSSLFPLLLFPRLSLVHRVSPKSSPRTLLHSLQPTQAFLHSLYALERDISALIAHDNTAKTGSASSAKVLLEIVVAEILLCRIAVKTLYTLVRRLLTRVEVLAIVFPVYTSGSAPGHEK